MEVKNPRNTREWQKRTAAMKSHAKRNNLPCWICGEAILFDEKYTHPLAFTTDHVEEIAAGGAVLRGAKLAPAHRSCNSSRSNTRAARLRQGRTVGTKLRPGTRSPMLDLTMEKPANGAKPERWSSRGGGVVTTIDWTGDGIPLYRK